MPRALSEGPRTQRVAMLTRVPVLFSLFPPVALSLRIR